MKLLSQDFSELQRIPAWCAFGGFENGRFRFGENLNPHLSWQDAPAGTMSFALICNDLDAANVTQEEWASGKVPQDVGTVSLCHWILIDIPASLTEIARGELSSGVYAGGKSGPSAKQGMRQGANDFTSFFSGDSMMKGTYFGYDGPCPPEGAKPHRYQFDLYALSTRKILDNVSVFRSSNVKAAMEGKILQVGSLTGLF